MQKTKNMLNVGGMAHTAIFLFTHICGSLVILFSLFSILSISIENFWIVLLSNIDLFFTILV